MVEAKELKVTKVPKVLLVDKARRVIRGLKEVRSQLEE